MKGFVLPLIISELKHIEMHDVPTEDGIIKTMVIDTQFPPVDKIVLKVSEQSFYLEFPHFSMNLKAEFIDKFDQKTSLEFSIKDLTTFMKYNIVS